MFIARYCLNFSYNVSDINECDNNPCLNGGSCNNAVGGYGCACVAGFQGENCAISMTFIDYIRDYIKKLYRKFHVMFPIFIYFNDVPKIGLLELKKINRSYKHALFMQR